MTKVVRHQRIEGISLAGIVNNGGYYYSDVEVYEDGRIDVWGMEDLATIKSRLTIPSLQLMAQIPDGETLSIHGLGDYRVKNTVWRHTRESYYQLILETVKRLNPEMANLYYCTEREQALWRERQVKLIAKSSPFRVVNERFYETEVGQSSRFFLRRKDENYLVNAVVYKSGQVQISCPFFDFLITLGEFKQRVKSGEFFTEFTEETTIQLAELGVVTFEVDEYGYTETIADKLEEMEVEYEKLNGNDRLQICRNAYHDYLEYPNERLRERLHKAWLDVPESMRCYLGDMDSRDSDYRRILFTDKKREV